MVDEVEDEVKDCGCGAGYFCPAAHELAFKYFPARVTSGKSPKELTWLTAKLVLERAESEKSTHARVRYENPASMPSTTCSNCTQFIDAQPVRCMSVKLPIHPSGWCKRHVTRST